MPASVSSMSRPYSSVSKWTPGESDATSAASRGASETSRSTLPAITSGTRASSIISESASSTSAKWNGRCTRLAGIHRQQIAKVVESGFLRGDVGDVGVVGRTPRGGRHALLNVADREAEQSIDRAHPLGVAPGQIVVERQDVHAATGERVERRGHHRRERLPLAREHLDDVPVVQGERRDDLHVEGALPEDAT